MGRRSVHLNLQNLQMDPSGTFVSINCASSSAGLTVNFAVTVDLSLFYRLCFHFGGCSTLYGCKGNGYIDFLLAGKEVLSVSTNNGKLVIAPASSVANAFVGNTSVCNEIVGHINQYLFFFLNFFLNFFFTKRNTLNPTIGPQISEYITNALTPLINSIPDSIQIDNQVNATWFFFSFFFKKINKGNFQIQQQLIQMEF